MGHPSRISRHKESILRRLNPGDLVQFPRGAFSHWAVYLGNGEVVHLAGVGSSVSGASTSASSFSSCGKIFHKAKVCRDNIWEVAKGSRARINNSKDEKWRPLSAEEIVNIASEKIGEVGYNVLFSNCEHFAKFCRYGISHSDQADVVMKAVVIPACEVAYFAGNVGAVFGGVLGCVFCILVTATADTVTTAARYASMKVPRKRSERFRPGGQLKSLCDIH